MKLSGYFCWENILILGKLACKLYIVVSVLRKSGKLGTRTACWLVGHVLMAQQEH
jgi:hypothetical protein